jgi:class 3 adenylate cyclase/SAM-dependent methyltransferase
LAVNSKKQPSKLEQRSAELLSKLGIEIPKGACRPIARDQRVAEEIMEAFLDNSGQQLVELLRGKDGARPTQEIPLHQLEAVVSLFYSTINDVYIGVDSHPPSRFLEVHPFLLGNLADGDDESDSTPPYDEHEECHASRRVRIVPFSPEQLQEDFDNNQNAAIRYFEQHKEHDVTLLSVSHAQKEEAHDGILEGEWTGDLGLWVNTCALLFEPSIKTGNDKLRLELIYPHDMRFEKFLRYVGQLIENGKRVWLAGRKEIKSAPLDKGFADHLVWGLQMMFEPRLADAWDEFVSPKRRVSKLGPFIEKQIEEAGIVKAVILDAAMGVGCDSAYLTEKGYDVVSNEIDSRLIAHALERAGQNGNEIDIRRFDWRHFEHLAEAESFNVVLALGNSLSCLSSAAEVRSVLSRFAHLLKPDGLLIVDERNYPAMFSQRQLMRNRDFRFPANVIYCSKTIQARPQSVPDEAGVDNDVLTLEYIRESDGRSVGTFDVLPFAEGQLKALLEDSGFRSVKEYFNLRSRGKDTKGAQFVTYVASRTYAGSELKRGKQVEVVIAFTDVSRSTAAKKKMGEERYSKAWQAHERQVRRLLRKHGGKIVNSTGDGFLLSFADPAKAVTCVKAIVDNPGSEDLMVRAGVAMGKATRDREGNLRGHDVDIAARICDTARPNLVVDDRIMLAVNTSYEWMQKKRVELRGAGERDLWVLAA